MGLDNGFIARGLRKEQVPTGIVYEDWSSEWIEFGYMRKCWGIRDMLVDAYHMTMDDFEHTLTENEYQPTLDILEHFLNEKNFIEDEASTIWTYEDYAPALRSNHAAMKWLFEYAKEHPEIEIVFYDSY